MGNLQLIIDNQVADIYSTNDILTAITYSIADISDLENRKNATTKTIKLPATSRNKQIFGHADDPTVTSFKGQRSGLPGVIRESGTEVLVGMVNLKSFQRAGTDAYFEITIVGNSGEWVETMRTTALRGIDLGSSHLKTKTVVETDPVLNDPYAYGLINTGYLGRWAMIKEIVNGGSGDAVFIVDGSAQHCNLWSGLGINQYVTGYTFENPNYNQRHKIIGYTTIDGREAYVTSTKYSGDSSGIIRNDVGCVYVEDRPLLLNIRNIVTKMFNLAGYSIVSTFIDSEFFRRLYYLPAYERRLQTFVDANYVKMGVTGESTSLATEGILPFKFRKTISNAALLYDGDTGYFTATEAMHIIVTATWAIKGTDDYQVYAQWDIQNALGEPDGIGREVVKVTVSEADFTTLTQEFEIRLMQGEKFAVGLSMPKMNGVAGDFTFGANSTLEFKVTDKVVKGSSIVLGDHLPDVKQIEFLTALRHLFNLYFLTDVNMKKVYIEPRDTFFKRDKFIDWSEKIDLSQPLILEELGADLPGTFIFKYKDDSSDWGVKEWERQNQRKLSQYSATNTNKFATKDEKKVENPHFAPTVMDHFPAIGLPESYLPKVWGEPPENDTYPEKVDEIVPRILYFAGMRDCQSGESWLWERFETVKTSFPLFCSYDPDTVNDYSLLFDPQPSTPDLFSKHYANYIKTVNEGRKITAWLSLNPSDISMLITPDNTGEVVKDFRSQVYIRHGGESIACRLESVNDYSAGKSQSTKVILTTDVDNISGQTIPFITSMQFDHNTLTIPTAYSSGLIYRQSTSWAVCRNGATGSVITQAMNSNIGIGSSWFAPASYRIGRAFLFFDTSIIPNSCTITEAYLDIYKIGGSHEEEIQVFASSAGSVLTLADYSRFGNFLFGSSSPGNLGLRRIYLNADGMAAINKTGWTKFCLREGYYDVGNNIPPSIYLNPFQTHLVNSPANYINRLTVKYI